jgi:hypothetical protein
LLRTYEERAVVRKYSETLVHRVTTTLRPSPNGPEALKLPETRVELDDLSIRSRISSQTGGATAVDIDANIDRWNGTITHSSGDRVEIDLQEEDGHFVGRKATVVFWNKTVFLVDNASTRNLKVGAYLEVVGLVEKDTLQVWRVIGFDPAGLQKVK